MKINELSAVLQDALTALIGKDIRQKCASELIPETISQLPQITPPFFAKDYHLFYDTASFGPIPLIEFRVQYDDDKRTLDGLGYRIKQIEAVPVRDLPADLDIANLAGRLKQDIAQERKAQAEDRILLLEKEIAAQKEIVKQMLAILAQEQGKEAAK